MRFTALLALILSACSSCNHSLPPVDPPYPVTASCQTACSNAADHGWDWGKPTPKGAPCRDVCINAEKFGDQWPTRCLTISQKADEADACWSASGQGKP